MNTDRYTYRVIWSVQDNEHVGLCAEFPTLSWLAETPEAALSGIRQIVRDCVHDLQSHDEPVPTPLSEKRYSGEFRVRVSPEVHRKLSSKA